VDLGVSVNMKKYILENVTSRPSLWEAKDPVRPDLNVKFKTAVGRGVFGLKGIDGEYKAFMCYSRTSDIPKCVRELDELTSVNGQIIIPYTVWSYEKGAGREIINRVVDLVRNSRMAERVVTLSPQTEMARNFHLRNEAVEFRVNETTVNFEYKVLEL
jgi:hypothetical protein